MSFSVLNNNNNKNNITIDQLLIHENTRESNRQREVAIGQRKILLSLLNTKAMKSSKKRGTIFQCNIYTCRMDSQIIHEDTDFVVQPESKISKQECRNLGQNSLKFITSMTRIVFTIKIFIRKYKSYEELILIRTSKYARR